MFPLLYVALPLVAWVQQDPKSAAPAAAPATVAKVAPADPAADSGRIESLRQRIHTMRMDLLLGGDRVRQAETDARRFYLEKVELVAKRQDSLAAELTEAHAGYQLALDQALQAKSDDQRRTALSEARERHRSVAGLESERDELSERQKQLEKLVAAVDARARDREKLSTRVVTEPEVGNPMALPIAGLGLAPEVEMLSPSSPLEDEGLVGDLLARDPVAARRLLYTSDPKGYWTLFPLQPPASALRSVLVLPPPDLPGQR